MSSCQSLWTLFVVLGLSHVLDLQVLGLSCTKSRTNISILEEIGLERELMGKVARMKLQYFGHVTRGSAGNVALTVLDGSIDGLRHQGRPKRQWMDGIEEWSGCSYNTFS